MTMVYVSTPGSQVQAALLCDLPMLVSFALYAPWLQRGGYMGSSSHLLLDSGAFSELTTGIKVDVHAYVDWVAEFPYAEAWAGLDDISGDWRRSEANYLHGGFPTFHDTDPPELLDDLIPMAREEQGWIGLGLKPPRTGREAWLRRTIERIPDDLHIHGWALGRYAHCPGMASRDSSHAWREWEKIRNALGPWLTSAEAMGLAVKKVQREGRSIETVECDQMELPA